MGPSRSCSFVQRDVHLGSAEPLRTFDLQEGTLPGLFLPGQVDALTPTELRADLADFPGEQGRGGSVFLWFVHSQRRSEASGPLSGDSGACSFLLRRERAAA